MGIYKETIDSAGADWVRLIRLAKSYTLYEVGKSRKVYVNFRLDGLQIRRSIGISGIENAEAFVKVAAGKANPAQDETVLKVDDAVLAKLIERMRYRAKKKCVDFSLTIDALRKVALLSGMKCAVSGRHFDVDGPFKASIDRIDPKLGYVPGNIRLVCYVANTAMLHFGESALIELALNVVKNRGLMPTQTDDQSQPARTPARGACTVRSLRATNAPLAA